MTNTLTNTLTNNGNDELYLNLLKKSLTRTIDDYYSHKGARQAVTEFRQEHGINDPIEQIDWAGAFWQRTAYRRMSRMLNT